MLQIVMDRVPEINQKRVHGNDAQGFSQFFHQSFTASSVETRNSGTKSITKLQMLKLAS